MGADPDQIVQDYITQKEENKTRCSTRPNPCPQSLPSELSPVPAQVLGTAQVQDPLRENTTAQFVAPVIASGAPPVPQVLLGHRSIRSYFAPIEALVAPPEPAPEPEVPEVLPDHCSIRSYSTLIGIKSSTAPAPPSSLPKAALKPACSSTPSEIEHRTSLPIGSLNSSGSFSDVYLDGIFNTIESTLPPNSDIMKTRIQSATNYISSASEDLSRPNFLDDLTVVDTESDDALGTTLSSRQLGASKSSNMQQVLKRVNSEVDIVGSHKKVRGVGYLILHIELQVDNRVRTTISEWRVTRKKISAYRQSAHEIPEEDRCSDRFAETEMLRLRLYRLRSHNWKRIFRLLMIAGH